MVFHVGFCALSHPLTNFGRSFNFDLRTNIRQTQTHTSFILYDFPALMVNQLPTQFNKLFKS